MLLIFQPIIPFIYLHFIFAILQFEISSLMNWIFLSAASCKIQFWNRPKIRFLKLEIFQTGELEQIGGQRIFVVHCNRLRAKQFFQAANF